MPPLDSATLTSRLAGRYALFALGLLTLIAAMVLAEAMGVHRTWIGVAFLVVPVAVYAFIGFLSRTAREAEYFVAGRRVPAVFNGLATAADWMSAASFIGTAGVLYLQGHAGLAYILGWTGGFCLLSLLLAPYLRRFGGYTVPDFLQARYGGCWPRRLGALAAVAVSFVYVVVQIYGVGLITSHLTGFSFELGVLVGLGGVLVCSFLGGMRAVTWTQVAQYLVLIVAYLVPLCWLSVRQAGHPLPMFSVATQLQVVAQRERDLLQDPAERDVREALRRRADDAARKLQDVPTAMRADEAAMQQTIAALRAENAPLARIQRAERELQSRPRTEADAALRYARERDSALQRAQPLAGLAPQTLAFGGRSGTATGVTAGGAPPVPSTGADTDAAGAVGGSGANSGAGGGTTRLNFIALMMTLMMGTAAMPHVLTRYLTTTGATQARRSVGWTLLFVVLLYLSVPALAVMVKFEVLTSIVGAPIDHLPQWVARWSRLDPTLVGVQDLNGDGLLQLGELVLSSDVIVLAAPEIGGLPYWVTCLVAAGGLAAALSTADGLLLTIANALTHDLWFPESGQAAGATARVIASKVLVMVVALLAALIAALKVTDILQFVATAFSLAAAAFFPALVLGIFWRRTTRAGALAGMLSGLAVCTWYMAVNLPLLRGLLGVNRPLAETQWWGVDPVAAGVFAVPAGALAAVVVSLLGRPDPAAQPLIDQLRSADEGPR